MYLSNLIEALLYERQIDAALLVELLE